MSNLFVMDVWKKGTNQYTSMPDYHIEISPGEINYFRDLISALEGIGEGIAPDHHKTPKSGEVVKVEKE
jgi:hypothetical protein